MWILVHTNCRHANVILRPTFETCLFARSLSRGLKSTLRWTRCDAVASEEMGRGVGSVDFSPHELSPRERHPQADF